jgi:hypothetical protein
MRTEVLDCVIVHTVVMAVEIFRGGEAFAALRAFRRSDVILLVSASGPSVQQMGDGNSKTDRRSHCRVNIFLQIFCPCS